MWYLCWALQGFFPVLKYHIEEAFKNSKDLFWYNSNLGGGAKAHDSVIPLSGMVIFYFSLLDGKFEREN